MAYDGSCHCGAVKFTVVGDPPTTAMSCNCSHCRRKGLLSFTPLETLSVIAGDDVLTEYRFNKHALAHRFCPTCGCQPFATGNGPDGKEIAAINLRCVPGIDLDRLDVEQVDGARF